METLRKWVPINFELISNPINWAIVILMLAIAGLALAVIFQPDNSNEKE